MEKLNVVPDQVMKSGEPKETFFSLYDALRPMIEAIVRKIEMENGTRNDKGVPESRRRFDGVL